MTRSDLVISVVEGADADLVRGFVRSASTSLQFARFSWEIVVVINGPDQPDGSDLIGLGATSVVKRTRPLGFAANHNHVMRTHSGRHYLLANDDVIVLPGTIERLLDFLDSPENDRVGVVSPKLLNFDGTLQPSTYAFPTVPRVVFGMTGLRDRLGTGKVARGLSLLAGHQSGHSRMWAHDRQLDVETLRGAFVMVRSSCVAAVGPMVEVALVGGEESEWHRRMRDAGWRVVFLPDVSVLHKGQATVSGRPELAAEYLKGALYFLENHTGRGPTLLARAAGIAIYSARWSAAKACLDVQARRVAQLCLMVAVHGAPPLAAAPVSTPALSAAQRALFNFGLSDSDATGDSGTFDSVSNERRNT